jgi:hypothetical protein
MRSAYGDEQPWAVGETRRMYGRIALCERGYHSSPSWLDALQYASGPIACVVDVSKPAAKDGDKQVSRRRTLLSAFNAERELRLFAADCAARALGRERHQGREPDPRSWRAVKVAIRWALGLEPSAEWEAAREAVCGVAREAVCGVAWMAARDTAWKAARDTAWQAVWDKTWDKTLVAAWDAEIAWQGKRLEWRLGRCRDGTNL